MGRSLLPFFLGVVLTMMVIDHACQEVTGDRCTCGIPNPVERSE